MRASSLSNARVIDLLNHHFVPAHVDGTFYQKNESVPADEKAAFQRVFQDLHRLNEKNRAEGKPALSVGTVHAYVLAPDGKPLASLHVAEAGPEQVTAMLEKAVEALKVPKGEPVAKPVPLSAPPKAKADALVLHLTARYLVAKNDPAARKDVDDELVPLAPSLGGAKSGQWSALPSEDWIVLDRADWQKLLPAGAVKVGDTWDADRDVTARLLTRFYPTTENNDLTTNRIDKQSLRGTVESVADGFVRARLEGGLKMKHTFYPRRDDDNAVEATLLGYVVFAADGRSAPTLRLVTEKATYGGPSKHFGAALRSVPAAR
jgi:hypothetical protein